jgi:hypothetical protein
MDQEANVSPAPPAPVSRDTTDKGHRSRQEDGSWAHCDGPVFYITITNPTGGGYMDYRCDGCGKRWSLS